MCTGPFAIITPYYKEAPEILKRCIDSVKKQSISADHFLISDGYPQDWIDSAGVRHLRLGVAHKDFGNTPRGLGALLAISEGYRAVGFLDADNWYDHDHVEQCCSAAKLIAATQPDLIIARRRVFLPDGTPINFTEEPNHVDTNCYWLLERAFPLAHYWLTMVPQVAPLGDRVFYRVVKTNSLKMQNTKSPTVNYVGNFEVFYRAAGMTPPPYAKAIIDVVPIFDWILRLDNHERLLASRRCGFDLMAWAQEVPGGALSQQ